MAESHNNLAITLGSQGKHAEAEQEFRHALAMREATLGSVDSRFAEFLVNVALSVCAQGRYEDAEQLLRPALSIFEATMGPEHPNMATLRNNLARVLGDDPHHFTAVLSRGPGARCQNHPGGTVELVPH